MYTYKPVYEDEEIYVSKEVQIGGLAIGIISFGTMGYPIAPGCIESAATFDHPVYYQPIESATVERAVTPNVDPLVLEELIKAGKELEKQACRAIIGACGYFGNYQQEVAAALNVPCFLSSILQVPVILRSLKPGKKVGIICAIGSALSSAPTLKNCGVDPSTIVIAGAEHGPEMKKAMGAVGHGNWKTLEQEVVGLAKKMVSENPDVGAILLECTFFPPFAWAVQEAVKLPVWDFTTMINWVYNAVVRRPFAGHIAGHI